MASPRVGGSVRRSCPPKAGRVAACPGGRSSQCCREHCCRGMGMSMGVAGQADIRPPEHAASRKERAQRALEGYWRQEGVNRQVPDAHGREVPSQKRYDRQCPYSSVAWAVVDLGWRPGSGGARGGARAARAAYEPARHLAHEAKVGGRGRGSVWGVTSVDR